MGGDLDPAGLAQAGFTDYPAGHARWIAVAVFAAVTAIGVIPLRPSAPLAAAMTFFAAEWLWTKPDPGWGAWLAGVTLTAAFGVLIRRDQDLLRQLRQAQAGLAEQARVAERNRIARELHDVIGHTLTVSLLHVQSTRLAVQHHPAWPCTASCRRR